MSGNDSPTLPEIKEVWMGPGRRGACMHTNKSTAAQHRILMTSHPHTNMHASLRTKEHVPFKIETIQVIPHHLCSTGC